MFYFATNQSIFKQKRTLELHIRLLILVWIFTRQLQFRQNYNQLTLLDLVLSIGPMCAKVTAS